MGIFYNHKSHNFGYGIIIFITDMIKNLILPNKNNESKEFDGYIKEKTNSYDHYLAMKKKYEEFSE